jgi:hypothetical protein
MRLQSNVVGVAVSLGVKSISPRLKYLETLVLQEM